MSEVREASAPERDISVPLIHSAAVPEHAASADTLDADGFMYRRLTPRAFHHFWLGLAGIFGFPKPSFYSDAFRAAVCSLAATRSSDPTLRHKAEHIVTATTIRRFDHRQAPRRKTTIVTMLALLDALTTTAAEAPTHPQEPA